VDRHGRGILTGAALTTLMVWVPSFSHLRNRQNGNRIIFVERDSAQDGKSSDWRELVSDEQYPTQVHP